MYMCLFVYVCVCGGGGGWWMRACVRACVHAMFPQSYLALFKRQAETQGAIRKDPAITITDNVHFLMKPDSIGTPRAYNVLTCVALSIQICTTCWLCMKREKERVRETHTQRPRRRQRRRWRQMEEESQGRSAPVLECIVDRGARRLVKYVQHE